MACMHAPAHCVDLLKSTQSLSAVQGGLVASISRKELRADCWRVLHSLEESCSISGPFSEFGGGLSTGAFGSGLDGFGCTASSVLCSVADDCARSSVGAGETDGAFCWAAHPENERSMMKIEMRTFMRLLFDYIHCGGQAEYRSLTHVE